MSGMDTQSELVERLQRRCSELEEQLSLERQRKDGQLSDAQQQQIDGIILQYKQKLAAVEEDKLAIEDENRRLRVELAKLDQQKTTLLAQVEAQSVELAQAQSHAGNDHIHHLEEQLKQYQIDFESERRDRSAAEARASELEYRLSRQMQQQDRQTMQSISQRREAALQFYRDDYDSQHHADGVMQTDSELPDGEAYDEIDSQTAQPSPVAKLSKKLADAVVLDSVKQ